MSTPKPRKPKSPPAEPATQPPTISVAATFEPTGSLVAWTKNPRRNAHAVGPVAESIKRFGFGAPIIARRADRVVIAGHTRLLAAKQLGLAEVPVRFVDLDEAQSAALALADNKLGELADWDDAALAGVLHDLEGLSCDLDGLGWTGDELAELLRDDSPATPRDPGITSNDKDALKAPFPYFGGKRSVAEYIWARLGAVKHYIEPFCGSAAVLLAAPQAASLEVVNDANGFIANFWRAVTHQPGEVAKHADYPVSHVDLGARHVWLMEQRTRLEAELQDANWPGDAKVAGWWLWGQCSWIGSGWCEWERARGAGKVPHVTSAGMGIQAAGKVPHVTSAGMGIQAAGKVPHVSDAGRGIQAAGKVPHVSNAGRGDLLTSGGRTAWDWLHKLADRLGRVRVVHGEWSRCLNHHYGKEATGIFFDPPYVAFEKLYGAGAANATPVAKDVEAWAKAHPELRIVLAGHVGDYDLPGWDMVQWQRVGHTYGGSGTTASEALWFSPACLPAPGVLPVAMDDGAEGTNEEPVTDEPEPS